MALAPGVLADMAGQHGTMVASSAAQGPSAPSAAPITWGSGSDKPPGVPDALPHGQDAGAPGLDLSMDLGDVLSLTEYEQGMYQRVEVYEQQLCSHAGQEIQAAVHRHEKWLNVKVDRV